MSRAALPWICLNAPQSLRDVGDPGARALEDLARWTLREALREEQTRPDPLGEALNSGDRSYRP